MRILITGGAGFIGSNFVHYMLTEHPEYKIVVLDKLTYAGRPENLQDVMGEITFIKGDICLPKDLEKAGGCDVIFNFAAETHVDRSITDAGVFVETEVLGTYHLLEHAKKEGVNRYIQISTDEVYGSIESGSFKEDDMLKPSSPYSASKAGADLLVTAYHRTYGLPVVTTRSSNNLGPYQYPEKLIPLLITNALRDKPLPIYGDGLNVRDWIYVRDNCSAIDTVFQKGKNGEVYNIAAADEKKNIDTAHLILELLGKPRDLIQFVPDRPGHDRRYSIDCQKLLELGWKPEYDFQTALKKTVDWYVANEWWWQPLIQE
jgi:dTDP-glucose 4,6-dehydratase